MIKKIKKAEMVQSELLKMIIAAVALLILIGIIMMMRGEFSGQEDKLGEAFNVLK